MITGPVKHGDDWTMLAAWGQAEPDPAVDRTHYRSPGLPPWEKRRGFPAWAWVSIVLGSIFLLCSGAIAMTALTESGTTKAFPSPTAELVPVVATGVCEKRVVGQYGLVATITLTNGSDRVQSGTAWVRWPITGEAARQFTRRITLAPGQAAEFPVSQDISARQWFRVGACSYGWIPD